MATSKFQDQYNDPNPPKEKGKRQTTKILGLTFLAVAVVLGSTFASRININGGTPVEFGQGLVVTAACSGSDFITVTPIATFDTPTSHFYLTDITFSHIPDSCLGKDLAITAYTDSSALTLDTGITSARIVYAGASTSQIYAGDSCSTTFNGAITGAAVTSPYGRFNLRLDGVIPKSEDVQKMTLISSDPGCSGGPKDGTEAQPGDSAYQILQDYPGSPDGIYWIQNANINGGNKFKIYADMTRNGGGWTLIVANGTYAHWDRAKAQKVNELDPPTNPSDLSSYGSGDDASKYSILGWADYIKRSPGTFRYRLEAGTFGQFGGIWSSPSSYLLYDPDNNKQTGVTNVTSFTGYDPTGATGDGACSGMDATIRNALPWLSTTGYMILGTAPNPSNCFWGSIIDSTGGQFHAGPWINPDNFAPAIIWYWVR